MVYKILFHYDNTEKTKAYIGQTFTYKKQRYVGLDDNLPKYYRSKSVAERTAQNLISNCVNTGNTFEVVGVLDEYDY